jgi:hypothetical protein
MDLQGQNGLLSTYRESWRTRGPVAIAVALGLMAFYVVLYFTDVFEPIARSMGIRN